VCRGAGGVEKASVARRDGRRRDVGTVCRGEGERGERGAGRVCQWVLDGEVVVDVGEALGRGVPLQLKRFLSDTALDRRALGGGVGRT
jgi:hypothetical protein